MLLNNDRLAILEVFLGDYESRFTGSSIAKKMKLNQKTVSNILKGLEREGLLKSTTEGKNKLYFFNLEDKENLINFIAALEHLKAIKFLKKNPLIKEISSKIKPYCKGIIAIFGSYAKGIQKEDSDLDIFIIGEYNAEAIDKAIEPYRIDINIRHYPEKVFENGIKNKDPFIEEIINSHILIKNGEQFIEQMLKWRKLSGA